MNKKNWKGRSHSIGRWLAKLVEEVGEVAREISDRPSLANLPLSDKDKKAMRRTITELTHVELIAREFRNDLERLLGEK